MVVISLEPVLVQMDANVISKPSYPGSVGITQRRDAVRFDFLFHAEGLQSQVLTELHVHSAGKPNISNVEYIPGF